MRGDPPPPGQTRRHWKFVWDDLDALPPTGGNDYQPKGGAMRLYQHGTFAGEKLEPFPAIKQKRKLQPFGRCIYCGRSHDADGARLALTSEHIIPEFLGAGLELPTASCHDCQKITGAIEHSIAREMFDPVRTAFAIKGKNGVPNNTNFPLDVGRETSQHDFVPLVHYPTVLVLPALYPASSYSRRPIQADDPFNFRMYNINADAKYLRMYGLKGFSSQHIDMVRFAQMIAKIAYAYAMYHWAGKLRPTVADFVRTHFPKEQEVVGHFGHVGGFLEGSEKPTSSLHELEAGKLSWGNLTYLAVRVRLFASYDMPSYYVTVGSP